MREIGQRMKENYEFRARHYLTRRTPVIVRVDGRAFHTLTKSYAKPFDLRFCASMQRAATDLFKLMQGCKMAYIQSDEASFVMTDYDTLNTEAWFDYKQSKIESVSAGHMSAAFCHHMADQGKPVIAGFDARAFNIPEDEVANYFLWRAQDWHRNSVSMFAQAHFSHQELFGKSIPEVHEMLHGIGQNWADLFLYAKNGTFLCRTSEGQGVVAADVSIIPKYSAISALWEKVRPETA
jgi:tRNA(His) 5'-end guanylyltransferase